MPWDVKPYRSAIVTLALILTAGGQPAGANPDQAEQFSAMQADMGASAFAEICVDTLPDFDGAADRLRALGATLEGGTWMLGGGALAISLLEDGARIGCVASLPGTINGAVLSQLLHELADRSIPAELGQRGDSPAIRLNAPSGPAFVVFAATPRQEALFFLEPARRQ